MPSIAPPASPAASARAIHDWIVARRRHLHQWPELSFGEEKTAKYVLEQLQWLGIEHIHTRINGNHGICAELLGRDRNRCIALRADMDALPIVEETMWEHRSKVEGVSHMCGHDAHTAMLLGAARILKEREADLPCTVRLFFQGGEEKFPGGARDFIEAGYLEGVDAIFGLHVEPFLDTGTLSVREGVVMAGVDEFTLTIRGVGGHAAFPDATRDPVLAAAHVVTALQQIVSRRISPAEPGVVSVTCIHGGSAFNVIPPSVELRGTVRSFRPDLHAVYSQEIRRISESVAAAFGCTAELVQPEGYPPLHNNPQAMGMMRRAAAEIFAQPLGDFQPVMGSEDFALYSRHVPAAFGFLGVASPTDEDRYFLHHPKFHLDEDALWRGAALHAMIALQGLDG